MLLPIYAGFTVLQRLQNVEYSPKYAGKVIVSTNIAEASVTLERMIYVISTGFVKVRAYNHKTCLEALVATPISKASALHRAGRASRVKLGQAFPLNTQELYSIPEMQRIDYFAIEGFWDRQCAMI